uniref:Uncharacterized protein n=1 Tax=viral metagenome TaxID=1070528 RepID=A0A6C0EUY2_9ZZZZ
MKVCVIGEGPIGLLVCIQLIHLKKKLNLADKLDITLYQSRTTFTRRHLLSLSPELIKQIEDIIDCPTCNGKITNGSLSINCIETLLFNYIDKSQLKIVNLKFLYSELLIRTQHVYDHIFCCDGFRSLNRNIIMMRANKYNPTQLITTDIILILYTNLPLNGVPVALNCYRKTPHKIMYTQDMLPAELKMENIHALLSIIYNTSKEINLFNDDDEKRKSINLWDVGYKDYNDFIETFTYIIKFLEKYNPEDIISVYVKINAKITKSIKDMLYNRGKINDIFEIYKEFVRDQIILLDTPDTKDIDSNLNKNFMIHTVNPNATTFGVILDKTEPSLLYATKTRLKENVWIIGDSAHSYPPGYAVEYGMRDVLYFVPYLIHYYFPFTSSSVPLPELIPGKYFMYDNTNKIKLRPNILSSICDQMHDINFIGGYDESNDKLNNKLNKLSSIMKMLTKKLCIQQVIPPLHLSKKTLKTIHIRDPLIISDNLIIFYNMYQLNNFFNNIINIFCNKTPTYKYNHTLYNSPQDVESSNQKMIHNANMLELIKNKNVLSEKDLETYLQYKNVLSEKDLETYLQYKNGYNRTESRASRASRASRESRTSRASRKAHLPSYAYTINPSFRASRAFRSKRPERA